MCVEGKCEPETLNLLVNERIQQSFYKDWVARVASIKVVSLPCGSVQVRRGRRVPFYY